ncbi:Probable Fe(2+)-trafficking protein [Candidatus Westeberhardia cardiocondylae]|uniref:Probable Fe(2+)-trafficking protein n=2 Tax=Candidatus Westeberhardia cardiocondylae TaxID=1594731 RepID=A0A0H5BWN7_9ENTR|nr:Probable Fe(2+)-trafficking protein [Candidatus Westeberhardia cardiocondylae]
MIYCFFLKKESEGQDFQFYPGKLGSRIYENISKEAWNIWKVKQTILINEKRLNMLNVKDRKMLEKEMIKFFFGNNKIVS